MADASHSGVVVLGLGYVGCVTAACLAELGHRVVGVDRDAYKVECVHEGRAPFFEPGLDELVAKNAAAGRLRASTRLADVLDEADVALICVGTPSDKNGNIGLEQLRRVCAELAELLPQRGRRLIVAVRSTVFPGTCEEIVMPALGNSHNAAVACNPEFLREGIAVRDFMEPSLVVVGSSDGAARQQVAGFYAALGVEPSLLDLRTAEMIKYACNTFHALKIDFANEMGALCTALGISAKQVMETLCCDVKLNISPAYLKPGVAFGGSCLPKDLRALAYRATRLDLKLPLLESVLASNDEHLARAIRALLDLPAKRIGFFGLAFKENTDDLRESTVVAMLEAMIGKGRDVRVFDPHIKLDQIYGSNRAFVFSAIPHISKLVDFSLDAILGWAEHLVITQKPASPFAEAIRRSGVPVLDLSGQFTAAKARVSG